MRSALRWVACVAVLGCHNESKEVPPAATGGPRAVSFVARTTSGQGNYGIPEQCCDLRIAGVTNELSGWCGYATNCAHAEARENASGSLVAYRTEADGPWSIVRIVGARGFDECGGGIGSSAPPAFDQIAPLSRVWSSLIHCSDRNETARALLPAIAESEGDIALLATARAMAAEARAGDDQARVALLAALDDRWLGPKVATAVCGVLRTPSGDLGEYERLAHICPVDDPAIADAAVARVTAAFAQGSAAAAGGDRAEADALEAATAIALRNERGAALARPACALLGKIPATDPRVTPAATILAATGTRCPATSAMLVALACEVGDCDGASCTPETLQQRLQTALHARWTMRDGWLDGAARALLTAAAATDAIPRAYTSRRARGDYAIVTDGCADQADGCPLPLDGRFAPIGDGTCEARALDGRHQIQIRHRR